MTESLSEEKLEETGAQLKSLPTAERFKQKAETALWEVFSGQADSGEEIMYENLSERSKQLIGTISSDEDEEDTGTPWWLNEFKWTATSVGEEDLVLNSKSHLSRFEEFVPEKTVVQRPELLHERLAASNDIYSALADFETIREELDKHLDLGNPAENGLNLPETIFTIQDGGIRTTAKFQEWFNALVNLCPPLNEQLTTLLLVNTKADEDISREMLPSKVIAPIEELGMFNGRVYNENYAEPLENLISYQWRAFDLRIPYVGESYDYLTPLEAALFENWANNNADFIRNNKQWFYIDGANTAKNIDSETQYARVAFRSPLTRKRGRSVFTTLSLRKNGRYSTANTEQGKRQEIDHILESYAGIATDG